jgi:hypothetical protein
MAKKNVHFYLIRLGRLAGWLLLPLVVLYLLTGFALCGEFGVDGWIDYQTALSVHRLFEWPLIGTFVVHAAVTVYFSLRRWGWIRSRPCKQVSPRPLTGTTPPGPSRRPPG